MRPSAVMHGIDEDVIQRNGYRIRQPQRMLLISPLPHAAAWERGRGESVQSVLTSYLLPKRIDVVSTLEPQRGMAHHSAATSWRITLVYVTPVLYLNATAHEFS